MVFLLQSPADVPVLLLISLITKRRHTALMVHIDLKGQVKLEPPYRSHEELIRTSFLFPWGGNKTLRALLHRVSFQRIAF